MNKYFLVSVWGFWPLMSCAGNQDAVRRNQAHRAALAENDSSSSGEELEALEVTGTAAAMPDIDLPYETFTLDNGLRVVVHTDRKAPVVGVSVWYHVGSKDEVKGKTGFAHLFEHLMFNGSENYDGEFFTPLRDIGATDFNGTTSRDRTNYYETVPTPGLELALWLESDRMGHLLGAVTQEKLDNQRDVVKNEKRVYENEPFGTTMYSVFEGIFPEGHPYRWHPIGSMEDLDAASLDDVHTWFKRYYGPNNAVLVLSGDIDKARAEELVQKYFGDIPPGPPLERLARWVPRHEETIRETMSARVPNVRLERHWAIPPRIERDTTMLEVVARILGVGKTSRLRQSLVDDAQVASTVSVGVDELELASVFSVRVDVKQGQDPSKAEALLDEAMAEFIRGGPTPDEVIAARSRINASVVKNVERVGGRSGKASLFAKGTLYANDPGFWKTQLRWSNEAAPRALRDIAKRWLTSGFYQLTTTPFGEPKALAKSPEEVRSKQPSVGSTPDLDFPTVERGRLDNGIEVLLAKRAAAPKVVVSIGFDAGWAADRADHVGLSSFTLDMLNQGTQKRDGLTLARDFDVLGASFGAFANLDRSNVSVSMLKTAVPEAITLFAEVVREPAFADAEIERVRRLTLESIAKTMAQPFQLPWNIFPPLLYGKGHPYANSPYGSGDATAVAKLTRSDLQRFRDRWLRPDNARIFVAGDTDLKTILPILNQAFGDWQPPDAQKGKKEFPAVAKKSGGRVLIVDRPGSPQTVLCAGHLLPPIGAENDLEIEMINAVVGLDSVLGRVGMNLREEKGWAYFAQSFIYSTSHERPFFTMALVQTDKTAQSMKEMISELEDVVDEQPITDDEFERNVKNSSWQLPGTYETTESVISAMRENERLGRDQDYVSTLAARYRALTLQNTRKTAQKVIHPDGLTWLVIGDRSLIEADIKKLGMGEVEILSPNKPSE